MVIPPNAVNHRVGGASGAKGKAAIIAVMVRPPASVPRRELFDK